MHFRTALLQVCLAMLMTLVTPFANRLPVLKSHSLADLIKAAIQATSAYKQRIV